jgi:cytochrome c biogenesis protein CcmG, thiol:disulfide interchange protein DsbE
MTRRLRVLSWTLLAGCAIAALVVFGLASGGSKQTGREAPQLPSERLAGPPVSLSSLLAGDHRRAALVVFWASWCEPCAHEAPALERLATSGLGQGRVVAVDWSDPESDNARAFIKRYSWSFPVLRDAEGTVGYQYGITNLPTSFVVGPDGRIRAILHGPQTQAEFAAALTSAERV